MADFVIYSHMIISNQESGEHIEYNIRVSSYHIENYTIMRKYSDFTNMHWSVREELEMLGQQCSGDVGWPMLPPVKFCGNMDPEFIESRKELLQEYLEFLLKIPGVVATDAFTQFIAPDKYRRVLRFSNGSGIFREYESLKKECEQSLDAISDVVTDVRRRFSTAQIEAPSPTKTEETSNRPNSPGKRYRSLSPKTMPKTFSISPIVQPRKSANLTTADKPTLQATEAAETDVAMDN